MSRDAEGMAELFRQFSFPGGIPSHAAAQTPGSINEGGELGYSLAIRFGIFLAGRASAADPHDTIAPAHTTRQTAALRPDARAALLCEWR